jgi:hypothetical protein
VRRSRTAYTSNRAHHRTAPKALSEQARVFAQVLLTDLAADQ